jgi:hypothetical protein
VRTPNPWLLGGLGAAVLLWVATRTQAGGDAADDAVGGALDFVDVSASRIGAALTSRGYRNNNPGNIRYIVRNPWNGQVGDDGGYGVYSDARLGTRALGKQLLAYAKAGRRTVRDIISTWAPANENNTGAYITDVANQLGIDPDDVFDVDASLVNLARAIAKHENGYLDSSYDWDTWVRLP